MIDFTAEHLLILFCALFFPPVLLMVLTVVALSLFGQSVGFNRYYVSCLLKIFEWSARQIHLSAKEKNQSSRNSRLELDDSGDMDSSDVELEHSTLLDDDFIGEKPIKSRKRRHSRPRIIFRETSVHFDDENGQQVANIWGWAVVRDSMHLVKAGIEAVIQDDVTSRFEAEQLVSWNMLTRTSLSFNQFINWKLSTIWALGFLFRYTVLLPMRLILLLTGVSFMIVSTAVIGLLPEGSQKRWFNERCLLCGHQILSSCVSAVITFNNRENRARNGGICVANHTSPIDVMILSTDCAYDLVGQRHGGFLGILQRALSRASSHIWFERGEARDRSFVAEKLKEHVENKNLLPILIFPEGTCINNTSVMMFKKGSFEVGTTIYPITMKYDSRFGDPFWNSSQHGWFENCFRMLTSWAIICDMEIVNTAFQPDENAVDFANRVKKEIAMRGGLVDLQWDGELKRSRVPTKLILHQQQKYFHRLARYFSEDMKKCISTPEINTIPSELSTLIALQVFQKEDVCTTNDATNEDFETQVNVGVACSRDVKCGDDVISSSRDLKEMKVQRESSKFDSDNGQAFHYTIPKTQPQIADASSSPLKAL
uniref:Phospholipid/glycerol acyltransferase domain-containing protein n=1 Tax=Setaria digitata TaxID=48799 RepID=A0A915PIW8_9BILA